MEANGPCMSELGDLRCGSVYGAHSFCESTSRGRQLTMDGGKKAVSSAIFLQLSRCEESRVIPSKRNLGYLHPIENLFFCFSSSFFLLRRQSMGRF